MLISVIIPVFNVAPYLRRCVDSLLKQTFRDFELILVDDGSSDGSSAICDEYQRTYLPSLQKEGQGDIVISVIHQKNAGVSAARNRGIAEAHGEYLSFVDADDWVEPGFLQAFADEVEQHKDVDLVVQGYKEDSGEEHRMDAAYVILDASAEHTIIETEETKLLGLVWNKLWKKSIIDRNGLGLNTKVTIGEDMLFLLSYLQYCRSMAIVPCTYYYYVNRVGSATDKEFAFDMWQEQSNNYHKLINIYTEKWPSMVEKFEANQFFTSLRALRIAYHTNVEKRKRIAFINNMRNWAIGNKYISYDKTILSNALIAKLVLYLSPSVTDKLLKAIYMLKAM